MNFLDNNPTWYEVRKAIVPEILEIDSNYINHAPLDTIRRLTKKYRKAQLIYCQTRGSSFGSTSSLAAYLYGYE